MSGGTWRKGQSGCSGRGWGRAFHTLTPQVAYEVLQHHLAVGLDVWAVHVRVEEDDGEGQDEDGVRVLELANQRWVTHTVPLTVWRTGDKDHNSRKGFNTTVQTLYILGLSFDTVLHNTTAFIYMHGQDWKP